MTRGVGRDFRSIDPQDRPPARETRGGNQASGSPGIVAFVVRGLPAAQGSARAFIANGRAIVATEANRASSPLGAWRTAIATEARGAMGNRPIITGPVSVSVSFRLPRPKSHFRRDGTLRDDAPHWCPKRPDGDKLTRAAWDALTGVVFADDDQVVDWGGSKRYADETGWTGVSMIVQELT